MIAAWVVEAAKTTEILRARRSFSFTGTGKGRFTIHKTTRWIELSERCGSCQSVPALSAHPPRICIIPFTSTILIGGLFQSLSPRIFALLLLSLPTFFLHLHPRAVSRDHVRLSFPISPPFQGTLSSFCLQNEFSSLLLPFPHTLISRSSFPLSFLLGKLVFSRAFFLGKSHFFSCQTSFFLLNLCSLLLLRFFFTSVFYSLSSGS